MDRGHQWGGRDDPAEGFVDNDRKVRRGQERHRHGLGRRLRLLRAGRSMGGTGLEHRRRRADRVVLLAAAERRGRRGTGGKAFENTVVTNEAAHSGNYSLKFDMPFDRSPHDGFVGTQRFLFNQTGKGSTVTKNRGGISSISDVQPGDVLRLSVWIKASNLVPDSAAMYPGTWSVGFTPLWFTGNTNNLGYNPVGPANDYTFAFPAVTSFAWKKYSLDVTVPTGVGANALEVRLHVYSRFTGTIYFDDLTVEKLDPPQPNLIGGFEGEYPAYWTEGSEPSSATLSWADRQSTD